MNIRQSILYLNGLYINLWEWRDYNTFQLEAMPLLQI